MKFLAPLLLLLAAFSALGSDLDTIGVTLLRQVDPTLLGDGIPVAQPEGPYLAEGAFEVNPIVVVGDTTNFITFISALGTSTNFPNAVGAHSDHADSVGENFYSPSVGVAPHVSHVDNYEANFFYSNYVQTGTPISARVVNQSFTFSYSDELQVDSDYDNYAAQYKTLFVSGAGNGGPVYPSATCYNGIGVGVNPGTSSFGTTPDGRSKPDIVSPGSLMTSFSTPYVSGSAAVLIQAGLRGDGGIYTNAASDIRTVKTLLLNGAIKPADWTNGINRPLDARYGAGVLNLFNSWHQLTGGKHSPIESTSVTSGSPHPPGSNPGNEPALTGWDFNSLTNSDASHDRINHYYFNLSNSFTLTATLTWLRPSNSATVNDLNLFLYNAADSNLVLSSTSTVDNVEHLFLTTLPAGRYDLQVQKNPISEVSTNETYALAFEFFNLKLGISQTNANAVISWPLAPTGFQLQSTTNLTATWTNVTAPVSVDTNADQNIVIVPITGNQFFRLQRP